MLSKHLRIYSFLFFVFLLTLGGCSTHRQSHFLHLKSNIDEIFAKLERLDNKQSESNSVSIPRSEALFCIEEASKSAKRADRYQTANNLMLGGAAFFGGAGLALSTAALSYDKKRELAVSAAVFSILPGAILGTREIFKTYEVARNERITSARNINTAITILRNFALLDDPSSSIERFRDCRNGHLSPHDWDESFAPHFDSKAKVGIENNVLHDAEEAVTILRRKLSLAKEKLGISHLKRSEAQKALDDLMAKHASQSDDASASKQIETAKAVFKSRDAEMAKLQQEADRQQLELDKARRISVLQRSVKEKTAEVIDAYAKLRRAVLYQSSEEVSVAFDIAEYARFELESARLELAKEKRAPILVRKVSKQTDLPPSPHVSPIAPLSNPYETTP